MAGNDLKKVLAEQYLYYIEGEQYFDFASVPYEFIEGALTPVTVTQAGIRPDFGLLDGWADLEYLRNRLGRALENVRHRKVHGHAKRPRKPQEWEAWRVASILDLLVLLDYIERSDCSHTGLYRQLSDALDSYWTQLRGKYGQNLGVLAGETAVPCPKRLTALNHFPQIHFVVFAVAYAARKSCNRSDVARTSQGTMEATLKLLASA